MDKIFIETVYFGIVISLLTYWVATKIRKKFPYPIFNPLLISAIITITILIIFDIDFETYNQGAKFITMLPVSYTHLYLSKKHNINTYYTKLPKLNTFYLSLIHI